MISIIDSLKNKCRAPGYRSIGQNSMDDSIDALVDDLVNKYPNQKFEPNVFYNREGDTFEVYLSSGDYFAERINGLLTVFRSSSDHTKVVGLAIKNIEKNLGLAVKPRERMEDEQAKVEYDR